jgi:chromosome segregation ATPase
MENEELLNRMEWLEAERRKDKQLINELTEKLSGMIDELTTQKSKIRAVEIDLKKTSQISLKNDEIEEAVSKQKVELEHSIQEIEKRISTNEIKVEKNRKDDLDAVTKRLLELQNELKPIGEIKKTVQSRIDEEYRISQKIDDLAKKLPAFVLADEEVQRAQKMLEDNYRLESKKLSDIQIEVSTLRKKIEEEKTTIDSQKEYVRKIESRINDLVVLEQQRKQDQLAFIETQSRSTIDRESLIKEWQKRIDQMESLGTGFQTQLIELENTHRAVKKSQVDFEEINQRLDRRINEITEMNRLAEERFRQDWISFKADDQKRWTNYSLNRDEESREATRDVAKIIERLAKLEDISQNLVDSVNIINEETEKRIKALLSLSNDLMSSFEQTLGKRI